MKWEFTVTTLSAALMMLVGTLYGQTPLYGQDISLNGTWECGHGPEYRFSAEVPGLAFDPTVAEAVRYRRQVRLPEGNWTDAVLELKGARFRPEVYVNGELRSSAEGGMTRTMHRLNGAGVAPGAEICLEIRLSSLDDVPKEDASFIPEVDQWRSNRSSCLWDDVVLHLYRGARADRALIDYRHGKRKATLSYRVTGSGAASAKISLGSITLTGSAQEGENKVSIDCRELAEWSPAHPECHQLHICLLDRDGKMLSKYSQTIGLREFRVKNKQFEMNGKPSQLRGGSVVWHRWVRDADAREVAFDAKWFGDNILRRIKEHGGNYIRFHLGVPPERILDLCDSLGLAVQYEWSFFHGLPASYESLVEQYGNWLDMASRHPSVCLFHPYNETDANELATAWKALDHILQQYPPLVLEDRDVLHIHRYWWGMSENLGLYYDSYKQFVKPIVVDEFGGIYLDHNGDMGGYPMIPKGMKRWLGANHTTAERLHQQELASGKVGEYWRRIGAAGLGVFPIASSFEDGNNWFLGNIAEGTPKPVWDAMTPAWSARSVSMDIWNRNFTPGQAVEVPTYLFNDTEEGAVLKVLYSVTTADGATILSEMKKYPMKPYFRDIQKYTFSLPKTCGDFTLSAKLLNPTEDVKAEVVSKWEIHVLKAEASENLKNAGIYIPDDERELRAMAVNEGLRLVDDPRDAKMIVMSSPDFGNMSKWYADLDVAISRGTSIVLLNAGKRTLGKSYNDKAHGLGQVSGSPKLLKADITHAELFAGISVNCVEVAEPESHIHPAQRDSSLWKGLSPGCTRLWNGLRGGLIVPAATIEIEGLSQEAFLAEWATKGADTEKIRKGEQLFAYEYCGFYSFDGRPDNAEAEASLRSQVAFLIEDMPALALSLPIHTPVRITDLTAGYKSNSGGRATGFTSLAEAGKDLVRTPVTCIFFREGEGRLVISQLLTEGRLADKVAKVGGTCPPCYDEAAVQLVLNMLDYALRGK